ncbi:MAG: phosphoribosyltransferase [Deltaproteobacteria bacterium]|nr:phosphoribosyltransferase [Deltaproteobacteria bacterium]
MAFDVPQNYSLIYSRQQISTRIVRLGAEITTWAKDVENNSTRQALAVCILRGGAFFFADLLRAVETSVEIAFCRAWSYCSESNVQQANTIRTYIEDIDATERDVLVVDDICDTGATLHKIQSDLLALGASSVKTAVLIHRKAANNTFVPNWVAMPHAGQEWFVGYGMEDRNRFSNLPDLYVISNSAQSKARP